MEICGAIFSGVKKRSKIRATGMQLIGFASVIAHSFIIWQGLIVASGSKSPIVVVLSASMEPAFKRGDIVFLHNNVFHGSVRNGEIVVYQLAGRDIPIIHRVISVHETSDGAVKVLTKGDHNPVDDRGIYEDAIPGLRWLAREDIIGRAVGLLPSVGRLSLIMQDYPIVKYTLFPALALLLLALGCFDG